jgi:hypothetical protein
MPQGRYRVSDGEGKTVGAEDFRCAPGPMGWRYFSEVQTDGPQPHHETIDVAVDANFHIARVRIDTGTHDVLLESSADTLRGYRDGVPIEIPVGPDLHLDYFTPATNAITCRCLTGTAEIDVVYLEPVTLEPSRVRQRYERRSDEEVDTPVGRFAATRWTYTSLPGGWTADLWIAGDIVVRYERLFELETYEPGASGPQPLA